MLRIVGIGPGNIGFLTQEARTVLENSHIVYGYERQIKGLESLVIKGKKIIYERLEELKVYLMNDKSRFDELQISVLASGEPSLYGIAKYVGELFSEEEIEIVSGISSVQYLFSKVKIPMNEVYITSCHGKEIPIEKVQAMDKIAFLTDKEKGPAYICDLFLMMGEDPLMVVGENLSYENEVITVCKSSELDKNKDYGMCVVLVIKDGYNER